MKNGGCNKFCTDVITFCITGAGNMVSDKRNSGKYDGKDTVKGTDAGTYDMELTAKDFANNNANFSNVEFIMVEL